MHCEVPRPFFREQVYEHHAEARYDRYELLRGTNAARHIITMVRDWQEKHIAQLADRVEIILYTKGEPVVRVERPYHNEYLYIDIIFPQGNGELRLQHRKTIMWPLMQHLIGWKL